MFTRWLSLNTLLFNTLSYQYCNDMRPRIIFIDSFQVRNMVSIEFLSNATADVLKAHFTLKKGEFKVNNYKEMLKCNRTCLPGLLHSQHKHF